MQRAAQQGQTHEEAVGRLSGTEPERRLEGLSLGSWQVLQTFEERLAELMDRGERELHLRLDPDCPQDPALLAPARYVLEQGCLADTGFPPKNHGLAVAGPGSLDVGVERRALARAAMQWHGLLPQ